MINTDEAVRLAAEALDSGDNGYIIQRGHINLDDVRLAVTAALPALAEQFAALIEAERDRIRKQYESWLRVVGFRDYDSEVAMDTLTTAAHLVREAAEVTG